MKRNKAEEKDPRSPLSDDELTVLEAGMEHMQDDRSKLPPHDRSEHAEFWRFLRNHRVLSILCLILALALLVGLVIGAVLLCKAIFSPTDTQLQRNEPVTLILGERDPVTLNYSSVVKDNVFYVDMMTIADYMGLTVSGTATRLCFEGDDSSTIQFENGKPYAVINGLPVSMDTRRVNDEEPSPAPALIHDGSCLVPVAFLQKAVESGFSLKLNSQTNTLRIRKVLTMVDGNKENAVPSPILFTADPFDEYVEPEEIDPMPRTPSYSTDISAYEASIQSEYLQLVNKTHSLKSTYEPSDLTKLTCPTAKSNTYYLRRDAARALSAMMAAMKADGVTDVYVTSAFRSYTKQQELYEGYVQDHMKNDGMTRKEAEALASSYSARAGQSEHQTGLCVDFTTNSMSGALDEDFEKTEAFRWLSQNAWKYGFILRYPKSDKKVAITGYDYEPWHFRFVGLDAAEEIDRRRLTLEEYVREKSDEN